MNQVISTGMIESELDLLELDIIDFKRQSHFRNQREALEVAASYLINMAKVTVIKVPDFWDIPDRDDFPGWDHVGQHPQVGKQFWNWFYHWNPESELYLGDGPDLCGTLKGGALFFGDIGMVSASAFVMSVKVMSVNDIWVSVSLDGSKQTIIELLAGGRQYVPREAPEHYPVCPIVNFPVLPPDYKPKQSKPIRRPAYIPVRPVVWPGQCQQLSLFEENVIKNPNLPKLKSKVGSGKW